MFYLKIMSEENKPDSNTSKGFMLIPVGESEYVETGRDEEGTPLVVVRKRGSIGRMSFPMTGNAYLLDGNKTIATYAYTEH